MTYAAQDLSIQDGDPVYLLYFVRDGAEWRYTNAALSVIALGETWLASSVSMGAKVLSKELAKNAIPFKFPRDNAFAAAFLAGRPDAVTSITVYRGHVGDADEEWQVWWKGRDVSTKYDRGTITIDAESIFTSSRRQGLREKFQKNCRHALYSSACGVNQSAFAEVVTAIEVDGVNVTIELSSSEPVDGYYRGGILKSADGSQRFIRAHSGENLTLSWPIDSLVAGDVTLYPGCDRTLATCDAVFDNSDMYGGFPWIPGEHNNPMGGSSIV